MDYSDADLPVEINEADVVTLADGTTVRYEENGGARDVMIGGDWSPRCTLYPGNTYDLDAGGKAYVLSATDSALKVAAA
ncbi:MAG: hypothetical protein D6E12_03505 [Desulfovibrio sp.]|nr:MAG: hypothetical protein D6E12_03505 [Desulfovibrio sp.]